MNNIVFLDRDGTINLDRSYVYKIEDFTFIKGSIEAMHLLTEHGYKIIIITNQSGIARGYYTEAEYLKLNDWMLGELRERGISILAVYYCPHFVHGKVKEYAVRCSCRKPAAGLFIRAMQEYEVDLNKSYAVGNQIRDILISRCTAIRGILLDAAGTYIYDPLYRIQDNWFVIKKDLLEAAEYMIKDR